MDTARLKRFAQEARKSLMEQVASKLNSVCTEGSPAQRDFPEAVQKLQECIAQEGENALIERVAYTWFNRFCALRFMDVCGYSSIQVLSPLEGQFLPEILAEAKAGHIEDSVPQKTRERVFGLLQGTIPPAVQGGDAQGEAYSLLVVAMCNHWAKVMPFMFQPIADYTELLMPDDLLSGVSIVAFTREAMTSAACESVEVIGWLYQFYISEKKDAVFEGMKKGKKITAENIPAATQLFTPHWIVRYLVENSLGRLWILNKPESSLVQHMPYYIAPQEGAESEDFIRIHSPEELKICDPACGSGHMLTYAFDLLYVIYEEEGYDKTEIPQLILHKNLFGMEIDERAANLAAFALTMKARKRDRRFFTRKTEHGTLPTPNICCLENVSLSVQELEEYCKTQMVDLSAPVMQTILQFKDAKNLGSLICPVASYEELQDAWDEVAPLRAGQSLSHFTKDAILTALKQSFYLSSRYHVVLANPPYMGGKGMNADLSTWAKNNYPDSKSDLFAMFMERGFSFLMEHGYSAMVTMQSWMFLSSYEKLRENLLKNSTIESLAHMANMVMGIAFGTSATVFKHGITNKKGAYCYVTYENIDTTNTPISFPPINERNKNAIANGGFYRASAADFSKIPGSPIAYWVSDTLREAFEKNNTLNMLGNARLGMATGNNDIYLRQWSEVSLTNIGFKIKDRQTAKVSYFKWFPYNKGGKFRRWFGNNEYVVNWENDGHLLRTTLHPSGDRLWAHNFNLDYIFKECLTFTATSSSYFGIRYSEKGFLFDNKGSSYFSSSEMLFPILGLLASKPVNSILKAINPTIEFQPGNVATIPFAENIDIFKVKENVTDIVSFSKSDWDAYETSWDFTSLPLLAPEHRKTSLAETYVVLRTHWQSMTEQMQNLEEENNRIFIEAYGLQEELTPEVPLKEITLTCNPHYRYGGEKTEEELESLLLADTMREFISYAVGCMFGRYSLDKAGLILANAGEGLAEFEAQVPHTSFMPDVDNVIPMLEGNWFSDDIVERFYTFLKLTFGEKHYADNLRFIENALGKDVRKYFFKDFYNDHIKRYKKRPIYWLFSSPKGNFNALIYMHRYRPETASIVLNEYLREFRTKLNAEMAAKENISISASSSPREKTAALKEITKIKAILQEIESYERDTLFHLATQKIEIDLDDGVKVNYPKFGKALKTIKGLDAKED